MSFDWPPKSVSFNTKGFPQAHHVIEHASETKPRTVKICRCWQSKKFPYCDDSHKLLMEHGDSVGPFIAQIDPLHPEKVKTEATLSQTNKSGAAGISVTRRLSGVPGKMAIGLMVVSSCLAVAATVDFNTLHYHN